MYAPASVATCVQASVGDQAVTAVHNIDEVSHPAMQLPICPSFAIDDTAGMNPNATTTSQCTPADYVTGEGDSVSNEASGWMLVGCFVSDQDGMSHAAPWSDGTRFVEESWEGCRQKAITENSAMFIMEYGQGCPLCLFRPALLCVLPPSPPPDHDAVG